ncbi:MAG: 2-oxoacid:acceptor oxidoreductase family protein, partial [Anaerolineae bacterium]|nr:2-oxoacid:acceptor oxidoreductase family protein [Anaerolineae bacterium]
EKLEALRFAHFVNPESGTILVNDYEIVPASVAGANESYPRHTTDYLRGKGFRVISVPASETARDLGDGRMANVVMLGALSTLLPIPQESWGKALQMRLPPRYLDGNVQAFGAGQQAIQAEQVRSKTN